MPMRDSTTIRLLLMATTMLGAHGICHAQVPTPPPTTTGGSETSQNEIVVTAQKRSEKLQNVPIQGAVLTGKTLDARQIKLTNELARTVRNLTIEKPDA